MLCGGRRERVTGLRRLGGARPGGQPLRSPAQEARAIARSLLPCPCLPAGGARDAVLNYRRAVLLHVRSWVPWWCWEVLVLAPFFVDVAIESQEVIVKVEEPDTTEDIDCKYIDCRKHHRPLNYEDSLHAAVSEQRRSSQWWKRGEISGSRPSRGHLGSYTFPAANARHCMYRVCFSLLSALLEIPSSRTKRYARKKIFKHGYRISLDHNNRIDRVLMNHSGTGVKKFNLKYFVPCDEAESYHRLNSWLQIAVTPTIEELDLAVWPKEATFSSEERKNGATFNFPCTLLSDMCRDSIWNLRLVNCALHPTFQLGLRSLKMLHLHDVHITGDELGCLLSSSFALERLELVCCNDIVRLEIPCLLQRFSVPEVFACSSLEVIENKAPNISRFWLAGEEVQISFGQSLKVKNLRLHYSCSISYAINTLPSCVPNLETLTIYSSREIVNAPMASGKFLHLKVLSINIFGSFFHRDYDYLSFVYFLDASPSLQTFRLYVATQSTYDSFEGDFSTLRRIPEHCHGKLKSAKITGFCRQKSMLELTRHIVENAVSLRRLTLDASPINHRYSGNSLGRK